MITHRCLAKRFQAGESMACIALREFNKHYMIEDLSLAWWQRHVEHAIRTVLRRHGIKRCPR